MMWDRIRKTTPNLGRPSPRSSSTPRGSLTRAPLWARAQGGAPLQAKLRVSQPGDPLEREADRTATAVMRAATPEAAGGAAETVQARSPSAGQPLPAAERRFFEPRFVANFGEVRVHTGPEAEQSARALNARAYTVGRDIVFGRGEYAPGTSSGRRLIAHELAHVVQQRAAPGPLVQRDLSAYNVEQTEVMPDYSGMGGATTLLTQTAEAPGLRAALAGLIADGKVSEIKSTSGNKSWFAANHHKNAQLADIEKAFSDAGYSDAGRLARSLYDIHGEYLYSNQKVTTVTLFGDVTSESGRRLQTERNRSMTEYEIRQARRVFGNAIDYTKVTIADASVSARVASVGGYARTIGNTINFPTGASRSMGLMIHELTHVWQYQKQGWTYAPEAIWAQVTEGYSYTPEGKTPDQALNEARAAGKTLYDYNKEQQGDILADYFRRLQAGSNVSAYQPFVNDVR